MFISWARPLAFGSLPAPMHTLSGVHMGANQAPITTHEKLSFGDITQRVNFGQNYRDLGHFVRVTFMAVPYRVSAPHFVAHLFSSWSQVAPCAPIATLSGPLKGHP